MVPDLPELSIIDIHSIVFHEKHDLQRTTPLIERIRRSGFFRNPPIVIPIEKDPAKGYMVLDGANRITALQAMGFPHILVQVVKIDDPGLKLENWNHVVWEMETRQLLASARDIEGINLDPTDDQDLEPDLWGDCGLALMQLPRGGLYTVCTPAGDLEQRVLLLNALVDCYNDQAKLDRTSQRKIKAFVDVYPNLAGMVVFPHFEIEQVIKLACCGCLLPTGITRFTVSPRALHVNYPLFELSADKSLEGKNANLRSWIQRRIAAKGVRFYAEATFLFDE
jgi:L-serine kinase (ATP) / ParB family transcriptional regulator, heme-responsive regulator